MKMNQRSEDNTFLGIIVFVSGILFFLLGLLAMPNKDKTEEKNEKQYVFYNVPTYTTIYEIVYPDSVFRYTAVHHSPSELSSHKGTNYLYSKKYVGSYRKRPDYWVDDWDNSELDVQTTAPIRIVSETVSYKKIKYVIK